MYIIISLYHTYISKYLLSYVLCIRRRLQIQYDDKMSKMKDEALGKLKELGNSILGNFGMSLDNFKMNQDPSTGSWNIR